MIQYTAGNTRKLKVAFQLGLEVNSSLSEELHVLSILFPIGGLDD